ncbi:MAG: hypothetical protein ABEI11_00060 [Haloarculaceae archaeon]
MTTEPPTAGGSVVLSGPDGLVVDDPGELRRLLHAILPDDETPRLNAVLRELAIERQRDRAREVPATDDEYVATVPPDDDRTPTEVVSTVFQGMFAIHHWVRFHDYALYHDQLGDHDTDAWHVHHIDSGAYIDTVNVAAFPSATALEGWLLDLQAAEPTSPAEWRAAQEGVDD